MVGFFRLRTFKCKKKKEMANSAINISANAQEVINLRKRIDELKAALSSMRQSADPKAYNKLNSELQATSIRYYRLVGDIQRYVVAQQQAERATTKSSDSLTDLLKKGAALAGITFGADRIWDLGKAIVRVHGEMQQLNIAFSTMLKSQEKADALMSGLKTFATDTPFGLMDSAKGAKQLLAYGTTAENIIGDLKMLGNVASGVSAPLGDIVYLYGTLRSQGRAYAVDIRQFAGRGIPIYAELAKVLKVNIDQVNELVSAGKVGFPEVEQAFKNMTSGGGMFEGLMEKQTASVTGQIEKLKDNIQFMFDAIGTSSEGAIYGAIDGASTLVENYQAVGEALTALIATYGTYKAILIADTAMQGVRTSAMYTAEAAELSKLLTVEQAANVSKQNLTKGTAAYVAAIKAEIAAAAESAQSKLAEQQADLNALMTKREQAREQMVNSQAKVQLLKQELAQTITNTQAEIESSLKKRMAVESEKQSRAALSVVRLQERKDAAIEQARALKEQEASAEKIAAKNREIASIQAKIAVARQEEIQHGRNVAAARAELKAGVDLSANKAVQTATTSLNTATQQANSAATQYNTLQRRYQVDWDKVQATQQAVNTAVTNANTVATSANITVTQLLTAAKAKLWTATKNLFSVLVPNPYILVAAAVIGAGYAIYKYATYTTEAEKAINKFNEEARNQINELNGVFDAYKKANEGTEEKKKLLETIKTKYGDYIKDLIDEKGRITDIEAAQKLANKALKESIALKIRNESINDATTKEVKKQAGYLGQLRKIIAGTKGTETANTMVSKIGDIFSNESKSVRDSALEAQKYLTDAGISLDETSSFWGDSAGRVLSNIQASVQNARNERKDIEDSFRGLVKDDSKPKTGDESTPTIISTYNDQLKSAQDNVSKLEKDLANLRKGIRPVDIKADVQFDFSKNIEEKAKELKDAQDKLSYLTTGQSYSASNKANNAAETAAEKARKTAQKTLDDQLKLDNDKAKASLDARNQELENQQALLNLEEDGFEKEQKQAEINHQKELLSIDKRAQELIEAKQKAERDAWDIKNPNPKTTYVNKTVSSSDLLLGQQSELNNSRDIANRTQIKANADLLKNLLEKYQDFNTKKIAVDKQYNKDLQALESQRTNDNSESINHSISQLKKQYEESISAINIDELRESIDWQTVFGDIDRVSSQSIENLRSKLKEYASEAGKNLAPTDMKTLTDAIDQLDKKYAELKPNKAFTDSFNDYKVATDNVKRLRQELEVIKSGGNITIGAEYDKESGKMTTVVKAQTQAEKDLTDAQNKRRQSLISLGTALQGYVSKSQQYLDLANETVSTLEAFGVKVPEGVSKTLEGLGQISSGMDDVSKGLTSMNPVLIAQGGIKALGGLANAVQGIFGKRNKAADDTKRLQDVTEKVSVANDAINSLLEKRIELIKESTAAERQHLSVLTNESLDAYQDYYDEQFNRLLGNDLYGKKGKNNNLSVEDVMKMYGLSSPEDFAKWWQSGGYGALTLQGYDLRDKDKYDSWASAYMDMIDKRKELAQTMDEEATQISFDSFRDSFLDTLSDMDSSSKDFAENFEGYLQKAMLNSLLTEKYQERIKNLYSMFSDYNADGNIDESEYKKLQDYEKQLTDDMIADRDRLKKSFGWDSSSSQSSSYGTSTSMDQETGGAILGRLTGVHEELIGIGQNVGYIAQWNQPMDEKFNVDVLRAPIESLNESCQRIELMMEENRNIALQTFYVVKDIKVDTSNLSEINDKLGRIESNTKAFKGK